MSFIKQKPPHAYLQNNQTEGCGVNSCNVWKLHDFWGMLWKEKPDMDDLKLSELEEFSAGGFTLTFRV